jgi:hypothetical protein
MKRLLVLSVGVFIGFGCSSNPGAAPSSGSGPRIVPSASEARQAEMIGKMKSLEGEWIGKDEKGETHTMCVFKTTSSGSIVREIMLPGSPLEMTNVYHMDGPDLLVTHYCDSGNQPRMRCKAAPGNQLVFVFDDVTNLSSAKESYMGSLTITIKDADHITEQWYSISDGKKEGPTTFELSRKK